MSPAVERGHADLDGQPQALHPFGQHLAQARKTRKSAADVLTGAGRFYAVIRKIPRGRVTTYGAVAALSGMPRAARQVGFALARAFGPNEGLPWQRVLGAKGRNHAHVTIVDPRGRARQRALLEAEGVRFDARDRVALAEFGWPRSGPAPRQPRRAPSNRRARPSKRRR